MGGLADTVKFGAVVVLAVKGVPAVVVVTAAGGANLKEKTVMDMTHSTCLRQLN